MTESAALSCRKFSAGELEMLFEKFLEDKYGYQAFVSVELNNEIWLPIEVAVEEEDSEEYLQFWTSLCEDMFKIKDKHQLEQPEFEMGDKLLQLCFGKPIESYFFGNAYMLADSDKLYIVFDEKGAVPLAEESVWKTKLDKLKEKIERFAFSASDFAALASERCELDEAMIDRAENDALLHFVCEGENAFNVLLSVRNHLGTGALMCKITCGAILDEETAFEEAKRVVAAICRLASAKHPEAEMEIDDRIRLLPMKMERHGHLSDVENAVRTLCRAGKNHNEIGDILSMSRKAADNAIQRIRKKEMQYGISFGV